MVEEVEGEVEEVVTAEVVTAEAVEQDPYTSLSCKMPLQRNIHKMILLSGQQQV